MPLPGLLLTRDLFFSSRITGTAAALGLKVEVAPTAAAACDQLKSADFGCLFVDLGDAAVNIAELLPALPAEHRPPVVAFGAHVAEQRLQDAAAAGCDEVLTRGQLSSRLPDLLKKYLAAQ